MKFKILCIKKYIILYIKMESQFWLENPNVLVESHSIWPTDYDIGRKI